jgi:hypothetical protein
MKMEMVASSEILVPIYRIIRSHIQETRNINIHRGISNLSIKLALIFAVSILLKNGCM